MLAIKLEFTIAVLALAAAREDTSLATFSTPGLAIAVVVTSGV